MIDLQVSVSQFMTEDVVYIHPENKLGRVKEIFDEHNIHHIPVVDQDLKLVGILSSTDFLHISRGVTPNAEAENEEIYKSYEVKDIMTTGIATITPSDTLGVAMEVFSRNWFHSLPICENGMLKGIITTHDIITYCYKNS